MDLYLVTKSSLYYPQSGTWDWRLLTADEIEAGNAFAAEDNDGAEVCLIKISAPSPVERPTYTVVDSR